MQYQPWEAIHVMIIMRKMFVCVIIRITETARFSRLRETFWKNIRNWGYFIPTVFAADSNPSLLRRSSAIHPSRYYWKPTTIYLEQRFAFLQMTPPTSSHKDTPKTISMLHYAGRTLNIQKRMRYSVASEKYSTSLTTTLTTYYNHHVLYSTT